MKNDVPWEHTHGREYHSKQGTRRQTLYVQTELDWKDQVGSKTKHVLTRTKSLKIDRKKKDRHISCKNSDETHAR